MSVLDIVRVVHTAPSARHVRRDEPLLRRRVRLLMLGATLTAVLLLYAVNAGGYPEYRNDDEGTYYAQAWAVAEEGVMAHYTYWYDHPMLGWVQLAPFLRVMDWLTGQDPVLVGGRLLMAGVMTTSAALLHRLARNLGVNAWAAIAVIPVWCCSPLTQFLGRQVFLDNIALMWLLVAFVLATGKPRLHAHIISGAAFGVAVLTKETALLAGPGLLLALHQHAWRPTRPFSLVGWLGASSLVIGAYALYATIKNELIPGAGHVSLIGAIDWQLHSRESSGFILTPGAGSNGVLHAWLALDPTLLTVGVILLPVALAVRTCRPIALTALAFIALAFRPSGYLPAMYVATVLPFLALVIVHLAWSAFTWSARIRPSAVGLGLGLAVGLACLAFVAQVGRPWALGARYALTADENAAYEQGMAYVTKHLPRDTIVVTDDVSWNDLVAAGWSGEKWRGPIWHFKLDRDPEAITALPHGWRDVDYIFTGPAMEVLMDTPSISWPKSPQVVSAVENSTLVAAWGPPGQEVELRKVNPQGRLGCQAWRCPPQEPAWSNPRSDDDRPRP